MAEQIKYGKVYSGKDSAKKGRITLEEFINQDRGVLNTIMKLNEGFNDPSLSVAIILGMNSSKTVKTQRRGRVLRAQEGKVVEIFNLVLKGTVEEQWFQNSVGNSNYITIDESNLVNLLEGKEITKKKNKQTSMLFRF
jgi:superfamily II DNA or RNA helicase